MFYYLLEVPCHVLCGIGLYPEGVWGMETMIISIIVIVPPPLSSLPLSSLSLLRNMQILLLLGSPFEEALILDERGSEGG